MSWGNWVAAFVIFTLIILPPRWDPAIRWKEWLEHRRRK